MLGALLLLVLRMEAVIRRTVVAWLGAGAVKHVRIVATLCFRWAVMALTRFAWALKGCFEWCLFSLENFHSHRQDMKRNDDLLPLCLVDI